MSKLWQKSYAVQGKDESINQALLSNFCVLLVDQKHARLFKLTHGHLHEEQDFFDPISQPTDKQGIFGKNSTLTPGGGSPEKHTPIRNHLKQYSSYLGKKTHQYMAKEGIDKVIIMASEKVYAILKAELTQFLSPDSFTILIGEFIKEPIEKVEEKVRKIIMNE